MPRVSVTKECGCTVRVPVFGTVENRESMARDAARGRCFECVKKERTDKSATTAKLDGLPELRGTMRQIAWAETIRADRLVAIDTLLRHIAPTLRSTSGQHRAEALQFCTSLGEARDLMLRSNRRSAFWIDSRNEDTVTLILHYVYMVWPDQTELVTPGDGEPFLERAARFRQWLEQANTDA